MNMNDPFGFMQSSSVRGYNPNLVSSVPAAPSVNAANMSDTERLAQLMQGNLAGQLDKGDKLAALSVLLRSVGRGSQVSPQQALAQFQQQKMQEVQGAIQIQELRKQAGRQAQRDALREDLLSKARTDEERAQIRILSDDSLDKFALQRLEQKAPDMEAKQKQLATYFQMRAEDPARASAYWRLINPTQVVGSIESGLKEYNVPEPPMEGGTAGAPPRGGITELTTPQPKPVEPTESERTAGFLTNRLKDALATIERVGKDNPDALRPSASTEAIRGILGETAANVVTSPERQQIEAAQIDALDAALTLGTGAAYTREQLEGYRKSYFPQVGDSDATVADKKRRRDVLFNSATIKAGRAAPKPSANQKPAPSGIKIISVKPRG